jgi:hypothetical protein
MSNNPVPVRSLFSPTMTVQVDPWSVNPLLDDAKQAVPSAVDLATVSNGDPPTCFESGDLPPFTASGVDPANLGLLPWRVRHAAATERDSARVFALLERYRHDDVVMDAADTSPGLEQYVGRFRDWLAGKWTNPDFARADPAQVEAAEGDFFDAMFGAADTAQQARIAAVNAANPPLPRTAADRAAR